MSVRVRFAPSPTGYLHVGASRTALFNYLFSKANSGTFILRSDDTDTVRSSDEFKVDIIEQMRWLGLEWDEGLERGGPHGAYRQSDRNERYREVAHDLIESGSAYYSFATSQQLEGFREVAHRSGTSPAYNGSLEPSLEERGERVAAGEPAVIRFRVPRPGETRFTDIVRDEMVFDHSQVDDFIILRSNGTPTYHLASTVDDVDYSITHIIRGEDLLSSTPKHILLTEAMGAEPAMYAHMSLLMGPDGKKLSKRHGDTAMSAYRAAGYLPEAINNYLAIIGGAIGEEEKVESISELISKFDLHSISKNPAVFDTKKLEWLNGVYIREMGESKFIETAVPLIEEDLGCTLDDTDLTKLGEIAPLIKERTKLLTEIPSQVRFLFHEIEEYDEKSWSKVMEKPEGSLALDAAAGVLGELDPWSTESIESALRGMLEETGLNARKGFQPVRVAVSGSTVSPPLFESLEILGREETMVRIARARGLLNP